jgi:hypothetical protein
MKVTLLLRCRIAGSQSRKMLKPVVAGNGRIKPLYALVNGKPEHHPEGVYQLRYKVNGRRVYETLGADAAEVGDGENKVVIAVNAEGKYTKLVGEEIDNALVGYFEPDTRWADLDDFAFPGRR